MLGGVPDLRLVPTTALTRALRRVLRRNPELLGYGHPAGHPKLRAALAGMLRATRGLTPESDGVCVTRGSQMALALTAESLLRPGDIVAVEAVGYRSAWQAFCRVGARIEPIAVDASGLCVPQLQALCQRENVRAVYLTPHHQYPTTVPLAPGRRLQLLELARRERFVVIEDDYDHEFHYEGRPLLPLASADDAVVYVGTLSKVFAPGLRIGYVVAPPAVLQELVRRRYYLDRQGDHHTEAALAELIEDGELQRHTRRMRRTYHARRDHCAELLRQHLGSALTFDVPNGGMALWARAAPDIDVQAWAARAEAQGVVVQTEQEFRWDGRAGSHLRLGYGALSEPELARAVRRLQESLPRPSVRRSGALSRPIGSRR
jgi:GntR family transcriptional regulator/MocR family aminotransferase